MSGYKPPRLPRLLREAFDETGLPWTLERGAKHHHLRLAGRLVSVLPQGTGWDKDPRAVRNSARDIRAAARRIKED